MMAEMLEESFMAEAYIVAAVRMAGGRRGGRLSGWHPADLAAQVIDALLDRTNADPALVDDVIMGCVLQAGEQSGCIGRMAVLASRLPKAVPGVTIDRQCGSSQQALHLRQAVMSGTMDCHRRRRGKHVAHSDGDVVGDLQERRVGALHEPDDPGALPRARVQPVHGR
jgi:hypothetical protein